MVGLVEQCVTENARGRSWLGRVHATLQWIGQPLWSGQDTIRWGHSNDHWQSWPEKLLEQFLHTVKTQEPITGFDEWLWSSLVAFVTVYREKDIRVTFKDGRKYRHKRIWYREAAVLKLFFKLSFNCLNCIFDFTESYCTWLLWKSADKGWKDPMSRKRNMEAIIAPEYVTMGELVHWNSMQKRFSSLLIGRTETDTPISKGSNGKTHCLYQVTARGWKGDSENQRDFKRIWCKVT